MTVIGCDDGSSGDSGGAVVSKEAISGKWEINNSENLTFEFTTDNIYIVVGNFNQLESRAVTQQVNVYSGRYTISNTKITLVGLGVIEVKSFSDEEFNFSLKLNNSNETYDFQAVKQDNTISSDSQTNLLCRYWKVVNVSDPQRKNEIGWFVLFSRAGTYLVTQNDGKSHVTEWRWKDTEQKILQYSTNWTTYGEVEIQALTSSSLTFVEKGVTYELVLGNK